MRRSLNARFLEHTTFWLAGYWGIAFAIWYLIELVLLVLNPIAVREVTESTLWVYLSLAKSQSALAPTFWFDLASWLMDFKKLQAYIFMSFWILTFAQLVSGPRAQVRWRPTKAQSLATEALAAYALLPFAVNIVVAGILSSLLSGAAVGITGSGTTAIWRVFSWHIDTLAALAFVAYRLAYISLTFVVSLHMVIGFECLLGRILAGQARRAVARYFVVVVAFTIAVAVVEWLVWNKTMGQYDWKRLADVLDNFLVGLFIVAVFGVLFFEHNQDPRNAEDVHELVDNSGDLAAVFALKPEAVGRIVGKLPRYAFLPIVSLLIPLFTYMILVGIYSKANGGNPDPARVAPIVARLDHRRKTDPAQPVTLREQIDEIKREYPLEGY